MKVERAAHELVDLLLFSLGTDIVLESTAISGIATPATTTVSIAMPKKVGLVDIADLDLKPGMLCQYFKDLGYHINVFCR